MERDLSIAHQRLTSLLEGTRHGSPREAVRWLVAVQAQEYRVSLWSIAQRLADPTDEVTLADAGDDGQLLRLHVLRQTWHWVLPEDVRWLLAATGPRLQAKNGPGYRQLGLDERTRGRCRELIGDALRGGVHLTRKELGERLLAGGIEAKGQRLAYIMMDAEFEAVVCSGARRGSQHTYALLDERAPGTCQLDHDTAIVELVRRYLASHGPATEKDLRAWATLRAQDLRPAFDALHDELSSEEHDGRTYWSIGPHTSPAVPASPSVRLLQPYDEYMMGYLDSRHVVDLAGRAGSLHPDAVIPNNVVLLDTQVAGNWKRTLGPRSATIDVYLHEPPEPAVEAAIRAAADEHASFLGLDAEVVLHDHQTAPRRFG